MHPPGIVGYILRGLQFFFGIIVLALSAALVANQPDGGSPSQVNYDVFVGVFSLLTWFYTVGASSVSPDGLGSPIIVLIMDALNTLFYFAGGIAMAVALRVHSCGNLDYINSNGIIAGSINRCHISQTLTAFLWFGSLSSHPLLTI
jgi:Membrane-associating domain